MIEIIISLFDCIFQICVTGLINTYKLLERKHIVGVLLMPVGIICLSLINALCAAVMSVVYIAYLVYLSIKVIRLNFQKEVIGFVILFILISIVILSYTIFYMFHKSIY